MSSASRYLLTLGVAGQTLAGEPRRAGLGLPRDRADEPGVRRDALARGGLLDRRLERLGQPQAEAGRELLARDSGVLGGLVDEHELGLLAGQADLDVAGGELRGELERRLAEQVEQLQAQIRGERVAEPLGDPRGALVAELAEALQVL